jgi:hypothetical protein
MRCRREEVTKDSSSDPARPQRQTSLSMCREVASALGGLAERVDRADVRMRERRGGARLLLEPQDANRNVGGKRSMVMNGKRYLSTLSSIQILPVTIRRLRITRLAATPISL